MIKRLLTNGIVTLLVATGIYGLQGVSLSFSGGTNFSHSGACPGLDTCAICKQIRRMFQPAAGSETAK